MRHTIYAASMDQAIDYVTAFAEGGLTKLREVIKNERKPIMPEEYDNSNQVALWKKANTESGVYEGHGDLEGKRIFTAYFLTLDKRTEKQPIGELWMRDEDRKLYNIPIFKKENGKLGGSTDDHWVNLWMNKDGGGKSPAIKFFFKEKEEREPVGAAAPSVSNEDIPF